MNNEENTGFEKEELYEEGKGPVILKPYNSKLVDIKSEPLTMSNLLDRFKFDEIELQPEYQRKGGLWSLTQKSRLIESILISIPLPFFYFDVRNDGKWEVVDGLQRLTSLKEYVYEKSFALCGLEYLIDLNGKKFNDLPRSYQRKINESNFATYQIREGTPDDVMMNIFKRINTGGIPLSSGEIRNAVYRGTAASLLKNMATQESFKVATRNSIKSDRMEDRDLVNRFLAFYMNSYENYDGSMDDFLDKALDDIKKKSDKKEWGNKNTQKIIEDFNNSMNTCWAIFEKNTFRKKIKNSDGSFLEKYGKLNKAMFECVSSNIAKLTKEEQDKLCKNKEFVNERYRGLFTTGFYDCVNSATGTKEHVDGRHKLFSKFLRDCLEEIC